MDLMELWSKPVSYKFTHEEIAFIKKKVPKKSYKVKYAFYTKKSAKNAYIALIIDSNPFATRRSGVENYWKYISERNLSNIEYQEVIQNFGCNNRRFIVYYYNCIEYLIIDDKKYDIDTPSEFISLAKRKGYTSNIQLKLNF